MDYIKGLMIILGLAFSSVALADKPSFIVFHTSWCGPCQLLEAELQYDENNLNKPLRLFVRDKVEKAWTVDAESPEGQAKMAEYGVEDSYPAIVVGKLIDGKFNPTHIYYGYTNVDQFKQQVLQQ